MISNKLIGLAALALLAGSMSVSAVGCSSDDSNADDDSDGGASSSSSSGGSSSGRPPPPVNDGGSSGAPSCAPAEVTSLEGGYPPAKAAVPGACTAANIQAMRDAAENGGDTLTFEQFFNAAGDTCKSCFLSAEADESWGLFAQGADGYFENPGWCYGVATGLPACGGAVSNSVQDICGSVACQECGERDPETGADDDVKAECKEEAAEACSPLYAQDLQGKCGGAEAQANIEAAEARCIPSGSATNLDVWLAQIAIGCGAATGDAGTGDGGDN